MDRSPSLLVNTLYLCSALLIKIICQQILNNMWMVIFSTNMNRKAAIHSGGRAIYELFQKIIHHFQISKLTSDMDRCEPIVILLINISPVFNYVPQELIISSVICVINEGGMDWHNSVG